MIEKLCPICLKIYKTFKCHHKKYCSRNCYKKTIKGKGNPKWKGGYLFNDGYKYIYKPDHPKATKMGYVLEHRLVMEKTIGRFLKKDEIVHHINHNKSDNKPENLCLLKSTGKHYIQHHLKKRDENGRFT